MKRFFTKRVNTREPGVHARWIYAGQQVCRYGGALARDLPHDTWRLSNGRDGALRPVVAWLVRVSDPDGRELVRRLEPHCTRCARGVTDVRAAAVALGLADAFASRQETTGGVRVGWRRNV